MKENESENKDQGKSGEGKKTRDPNNFKAEKDFCCRLKGKKIEIKKGDDVKKLKLSEGFIANLRTEEVI